MRIPLRSSAMSLTIAVWLGCAAGQAETPTGQVVQIDAPGVGRDPCLGGPHSGRFLTR